MNKRACEKCIDKLTKEQKEELRQEMIRRLTIMEDVLQRAIDNDNEKTLQKQNEVKNERKN